MTELQASRTLVKSPPELWAECSDAAALSRHLGGFGEIRITRLDPETAVTWEGENVRGTVQIEPAGWGTKVILTAEQPEEEAVPVEASAAPDPVMLPEPLVAPAETPEPPEPEPAARKRRFARLRAFLYGPRPIEALPGVEPPPEPEVVDPVPEPVAVEARPEIEAVMPEAVPPDEPASEPSAPATEEALSAALDSLGQAHHRPYSRA